MFKLGQKVRLNKAAIEEFKRHLPAFCDADLHVMRISNGVAGLPIYQVTTRDGLSWNFAESWFERNEPKRRKLPSWW